MCTPSLNLVFFGKTYRFVFGFETFFEGFPFILFLRLSFDSYSSPCKCSHDDLERDEDQQEETRQQVHHLAAGQRAAAAWQGRRRSQATL